MKIQPDTPARNFLSIGHSNIPAEHFLALLHGAGVDVVADVRSVPQSRFCPWFSQRPLAAMLVAAGINYSAMGESLGGRPRHDRLYRHGVADYEAMAIESDYVAGLDRLLDIAARARVCLMCAEREPLDCHRCLLVARSLAERGIETYGLDLTRPHTAIPVARIIAPGLQAEPSSIVTSRLSAMIAQTGGGEAQTGGIPLI